LPLISLALITGAAQSRTKRITSIWTATGAEGARVHIVSDTPVSDYEAYKRGDRFYVKIPLADLPAARGSLLGRGFDDVQIQRYGDGIILSFRLQPGTTARVEQTLNRLEIVFSTPLRRQSQGSQPSVADPVNRTRARRIADAAGPAPSSSTMQRLSRQPNAGRDLPTASKPGMTTGRVTTRSQIAKVPGVNTGQNKVNRSATGSSKAEAKASIDPRAGQSSSSRDSGAKASVTPPASKTVGRSPSPFPSPLASPSPAASASPTTASGSSVSASPFSTPVAAATPTAPEPSSASSPNPAATSRSIDWAGKAHYWKVWAELNWLPLLIGGAIGLTLLVLMLFWRGMKRKRGAAPEPAAENTFRRDAPTVNVASMESAPATQSNIAAAPVEAPQALPPQTRAAAQPNSSDSRRAEQQKDGSEGQEREVFEL